MRTLLAIAAGLLSTSPCFAADVARHASLTLDGAQRAVTAAIQFARANKAPGGAIAVVDSGGNTILVTRLDGTFAAGTDISVGKARTAMLFARPTRLIEETINKGRTAMTTLPAVTHFTPLQGGIPIVVGGEVVGAIGISGAASAQQDEEIALAGAAAASASVDAQVALFKARDFDAALRRGETGDTLLTGPQFRINASRRDAPGQAEVHRHDTDIFYVLAGSAEVVIGGDIVEAREVAPGELRGFGLRGGATQAIAAGDVLTIPAGTAHWFKTVKAPFHYFVVKATTSP